MEIERDVLLHRLVDIRYQRNDIAFERNTFRVRGDVVEIIPAHTNDYAIRVEFFGDEIERISEVNPLTGQTRGQYSHAAIYPASHYVTTDEKTEKAIQEIEMEMQERIKYFESEGKLLEAQRIKQRTQYDMEMLRELGYCQGIENYSRIMSGRAPGSTPTRYSITSEDFLLFVDESRYASTGARNVLCARSRKTSLLISVSACLQHITGHSTLRSSSLR